MKSLEGLNFDNKLSSKSVHSELYYKKVSDLFERTIINEHQTNS